MTRLNQTLATEPGIRNRAHEVKTRLHRATQTKEAVTGHQKTYSPRDADGQDYPDETHPVQTRTEAVFIELRKALEPLFDVTAQKDLANTDTLAPVQVNGVEVIRAMPPTYLLFLSKQLTDLRTFVEKMVELDPGIDWEWDDEAGMYQAPPVRAEKFRKDSVPVTLAEATTEHPAQATLVTKDVPVGHWDTVKLSGAIPRAEKERILERIDALTRGVQFALEEANQINVEEGIALGRTALDFVFGE